MVKTHIDRSKFVDEMSVRTIFNHTRQFYTWLIKHCQDFFVPFQWRAASMVIPTNRLSRLVISQYLFNFEISFKILLYKYMKIKKICTENKVSCCLASFPFFKKSPCCVLKDLWCENHHNLGNEEASSGNFCLWVELSKLCFETRCFYPWLFDSLSPL